MDSWNFSLICSVIMLILFITMESILVIHFVEKNHPDNNEDILVLYGSNACFGDITTY